MFGEKPIYGQSEVKVDDRGRMFLPAYTKRERDDELILLYDENLSVYEIHRVDDYNKIIKYLEEKILNSTNKSAEISYKKKIYEISKSILKSLQVDNQGRVVLGNIFPDTEKVLCIGAFDHLIIEPIKNNKEVKKH